ncbi:NAD(P)/FAD-dependent oxidoreductase [Thiohalophilus sp.]|uniref:NAD(P)/FAD-dependent oxidoreductase n=1 Tax=Thiohalophilus sp. TaxID=3028392 RepID=UPI002ACE700D|nr:NAD(P)/FAD-dependent oxidoreductase [Thiohalophilus sp.]MDZ7663097.1 NAD(P)/FAD-dependent oxidoreductase [Thiohalophilus sp.]
MYKTTDQEQNKRINRCQVVVIGGGPAGSTVAARLAQKGRDVVLLEKDHHPRFHIGESLLPMNLPLFKELGLDEAVQDIGVMKYGAEFNIPEAPDKPRTYYFDRALNTDTPPHAYEVRRSEFDHLLLKNCARLGARVCEGMKVTHVELNTGNTRRVTVQNDDGNLHYYDTEFVVDASGRDTFLSRRLNLKSRNPEHNSAAIFGHFKGVTRRPGRDAGNISIYWFTHGWFWMIPLRDDTVSVGAVCFPEYLKQRQCPPEEFLWQTLALCPPALERMKHAHCVGEVNATGNFSYMSGKAHGPGFLLVGDAFTFVDPVFSSGVYIAMSSAFRAADAVDRCLAQPTKASRILDAYERDIRRAVKRFSWMIYRFNSPAMRQLFMAPRNLLKMEQAVISLLAGDVYRTTRVQWALMAFKSIYYFVFIRHLHRTLEFYLRRRRNARLKFVGGTTQQDEI